MRKNNFPRRPLSVPLHTLLTLYDALVGFANPSLIRGSVFIALFAGAEGWLLLDMGWFVLLLDFKVKLQLQRGKGRRLTQHFVINPYASRNIRAESKTLKDTIKTYITITDRLKIVSLIAFRQTILSLYSNSTIIPDCVGKIL